EGARAHPPQGRHPRPAGHRRRAGAAGARLHGGLAGAHRPAGGARGGGLLAARADLPDAAGQPADRGLRDPGAL
ncbi:MAG: Phosphoribosylformylglycinamidine synthase, PurS subunit, partial [uncultured Solirubrobacteraceae bacterium]